MNSNRTYGIWLTDYYESGRPDCSTDSYKIRHRQGEGVPKTAGHLSSIHTELQLL